MYRAFVFSTIYCPRHPCDRKCGLFHPYYIAHSRGEEWTAKKGESTFLPTDSSKYSRSSEVSSRPSDQSYNDVFEEIMASAARKVSPSYVSPPLPRAVHPAISSSRARSKSRMQRASSIYEDTTTLHYSTSSPLQSDSDSEIVPNLNIAPPSIIDEEESSGIDNLLREMAHDSYSNPINHNFKDEHIFREDDDDFIDLDKVHLSNPRRLSVESYSTPPIPIRRPEFERSLFESSLDIPDVTGAK